MLQIRPRDRRQLIFSSASKFMAFFIIKNAAFTVCMDSCFSPRFEMDYILASLKKPYVAILDGITSTLISLSEVPL